MYICQSPRVQHFSAFIITVLFHSYSYSDSPKLSLPSELSGFLGQSLVINITVNANPNNNTLKWFIDGHILIPANNLIINGSALMFSNLTNSDIANYTLQASNGIGNNTNITFSLTAYGMLLTVYIYYCIFIIDLLLDGPYFIEGDANSTILTEYKTDSNYNLTCTIKSSNPPVTELSLLPEKGHNWYTIKDGVKTITAVFTNAIAINNTRQFTCVAKNNVTVSTLTFDNYIGGQ